MSNNISRWFWYLSAVVVLFLICVILYPSIVLPEIPYKLGMHAIAEAFVLVVVLSILRKLSMLTSWDLIAYHAIIVGGSLFINFLSSPMDTANIWILAISTSILFVSLNVVLSKIIFVVNFRKACLLGTIMGLINAFMVIAGTTVYR